jgi:hypothetical protein
MANYDGLLVSIIAYPSGVGRAPWLDEPISLQLGAPWMATGIRIGSRTSTQPVDEPRLNSGGNGAFSIGFGALFYNRVQIDPSIIDLGNLLTVQTRQVHLWNGYLQPMDLESIQSINAEGVYINTPVPVPSTLGPLQEVIYTLTGDTEGPGQIDAQFAWTIEGDEYFLRVIGNRIVVFPFLADWKDGISEQLSWMSSVERSYDGSEQRRELRNAPRKNLQYQIKLLDRNDSARFENILFGWQGRSFAVPIPTSRTRLTATVGAASSILPIDTRDRGFYAGQAAVIMLSSKEFEAVEIATVSDSQVTLVRPTAQSWPKSAYVFAAGTAHLQQQQVFNRANDFYGSSPLNWDFSVTDQNANVQTGAAAVTYRSQEVYLVKPNWSSRPSYTFQDMFDVFGVDDVGALDYATTSDWPTIIRQHAYQFRTRADIAAFRRFLRRRSGRVVPAWIPSWNDDFIVTEDVESSAGVLTVIDNGYRTFVDAHEVRRDIAIFRRGVALPIMRRITDVVDNFDGTVNLVLDTTVGATFPTEQIKRVCHMNLFRLGSDSVTLQWHTDIAMSATLNFIMVKG